MNTYLVIITTALVITQIIRLIQNTISLHRQNLEVKKSVDWIDDCDIKKRDFEIQKEVFYMLHTYLKSKIEEE